MEERVGRSLIGDVASKGSRTLDQSHGIMTRHVPLLSSVHSPEGTERGCVHVEPHDMGFHLR